MERREAERLAKELAHANRRNWVVYENIEGDFDIASAICGAERALDSVWRVVAWYEADGTRRTSGDDIAWWRVTVHYVNRENGSTGTRQWLLRMGRLDAIQRARENFDRTLSAYDRTRIDVRKEL